jgi:hypothetical protein
MSTTVSLGSRLGGLVLGAVFILLGVMFIVLGVTFFPIIGIIMAIPLLGLSLHFLRPMVQVTIKAEPAKKLVPAKEADVEEGVPAAVGQAA